MTRLKKLTALLVSAALALSLLAGCGGSKALSQVIADLLSGMYNNVTVEVDPDLTAALKKAAAAGSTQEEVLAALVEELNLSGVRLTLRQLEEGQQGDHGVELVFQSGADPDAAARSAVNGWASAFGALPDDGSYTARVSMIEAEGGYYIAVDVEVLKAGSHDKDDSDDDKDDEDGEDGGDDTTAYTQDKDENGNITSVTIKAKNGLQQLVDDLAKEGQDPATALAAVDITLNCDVTLTGNWTPIGAGSYSEGSHPYTGTFDGQGHTIFGLDFSSIDEYAGLFGCIGESGGKKGTVQNLTLDSPTVSSDDFGSAGAVAGVNDGGTIENCHVVAGTVTNQIGSGIVGGVVGINRGTVTSCSSSASVPLSHNAGGVVGINESSGKVIACYSTGAVNTTSGNAGGVVGSNSGTVTACYSAGTVTGKGLGDAGGVVGSNSGTVTACYATGSVTSTSGTAGGVVGVNDSGTVDVCYWSGTGPTYGIGSPGSDDDATKVDGSTTTWSAATTAMNNAIPDTTGWWYVPNDDSAPTKFTQTNPASSTTP